MRVFEILIFGRVEHAPMHNSTACFRIFEKSIFRKVPKLTVHCFPDYYVLSIYRFHCFPTIIYSFFPFPSAGRLARF